MYHCWKRRNRKSETLSPRQKPSSSSATKIGGIPEMRKKTNLPQVRWVGTVARVPGGDTARDKGGEAREVEVARLCERHWGSDLWSEMTR